MEFHLFSKGSDQFVDGRIGHRLLDALRDDHVAR